MSVFMLSFEVSISICNILRKIFCLDLDLLFILLIIELVYLALLLKFFICLGILNFLEFLLRIEDFFEHLLLLSLGESCPAVHGRSFSPIKVGDLVFHGQLRVVFFLISWPQGRFALLIAFDHIFQSLFGLGINSFHKLFILILGCLVLSILLREILLENFRFNQFQPYSSVQVDSEAENVIQEADCADYCEIVDDVARELLFL